MCPSGVVKIQEAQDTLPLPVSCPSVPPLCTRIALTELCSPLDLLCQEGLGGCWKGFQGKDTIPGQKQQLERGPSS